MPPLHPRTQPLHAAVYAALFSLPVTGAHADESRLETVEVRARQLQSDLLRQQALTPGGISLVDGEELYQRNVGNLADMLRYTPGIWSDSNNGGDSVFISSRGSNLDATDYDSNGIKLLQDGLPVTTADGNNHNRFIDPLAARYASIARGANALTYGASTLGGAINFQSPTARDTAPVQAFLSGGSDGLLNARASIGGVSDNGLDGLLTVEHKAFDGYREHSSQRRDGLYANTGWQFSERGETRIYFTWLDNENELPGNLSAEQLEEDPDQATEDARRGDYAWNVESWRLANITRWQLSDNSDLSFGLSWEEQALYHPIVDVEVDFDGPGPMPPTQVFSLLIDTDHRNAGANARYNLRAGNHDLLFGIDFGDNKVTGGNYSHRGGERTRLDTRVDNSARSVEAFAVDRWQFASDWTLVYGLQALWTEREIWNQSVASDAVRNPEGDYDNVNPRLGLIYDVSDSIALFANLSRTYEAPTNYELEDDASASNALLDAMRGTVLEVGSRGQQAIGTHSNWHWDVALYYGAINDEILSVDDPAAPGTSLSANVDSTVHAGIEALVGGNFALDNGGVHSLQPTLSFTLNEFSFDDDAVYGDNQLPAAPGYALRGELLYRHASGFYVGPTFDVIDERYADFANTYKVDSYELLGLRAGFSRDRWELFAELKNLLDEDYIATVKVRDVAAADAPVLAPGAPLSAFAGVRFAL
ncbi:TonB-dependent receptor family protein [Parahaliea aestuarii]|uniref:TonB-dependent receptor plug domain-containing protein n=1 Tax=Parahaliea aestuarii TaxID=1852021 RepID=A0A5C8ZTB6_9GAMM|nr:TonB-dependent receptor [Parahaliea aestuarii]TXS91675.1 TonB-dependent receptor plug domain-containing protein [Parahaliea aestuarii]